MRRSGAELLVGDDHGCGSCFDSNAFPEERAGSHCDLDRHHHVRDYAPPGGRNSSRSHDLDRQHANHHWNDRSRLDEGHLGDPVNEEVVVAVSDRRARVGSDLFAVLFVGTAPFVLIETVPTWILAALAVTGVLVSVFVVYRLSLDVVVTRGRGRAAEKVVLARRVAVSESGVLEMRSRFRRFSTTRVTPNTGPSRRVRSDIGTVAQALKRLDYSVDAVPDDDGLRTTRVAYTSG